MSVLPAVLNYSDSPMGLPDDCVSKIIVVNPTNGSSYGPSSSVIFDLPQIGFMDPSSLTLKYKYTLTSNTNAEIIGCPVYSFINRLETIVNSTTIENISQYNQVAVMNTNLQMDTAAKYGSAASFGYNDIAAAAPFENLDGRICAVANESNTLGAFLPCILSSCSKLVPLGMMPSTRIQLTLESIANVFTTAVVPTAYTLTNVELSYSCLTSPTFDAAVKSMGPVISLKSYSYFNSAASLGAAVSGQVALVYNTRLASIKAAYILASGLTAASCLNKWGDSYDVTQSNGDYSLTIAGVQYPPRALSTVNNKNGILATLRQAVGSVADRMNSMSINAAEWGVDAADTTTVRIPGKFIVGIPLDRLKGQLLGGVSSQNSSITLNINIGTATAQAYNVNLVLCADTIILIDQMTQQVTVRQ